MPFQKGRSGNPGGRPKKGDSLADLIRTEGKKSGKREMVQRMWTLASKPHDRPDIAVKAAEWCAKHGWPEEAKGTTIDVSSTGPMTVTFRDADT